ncbi:hypothetical protein C2E23DRAFT_719497 [Lenzites betulinus]|nr:hypothetical protein C2E23DRAFT_719497 [Lenzites betulinus]
MCSFVIGLGTGHRKGMSACSARRPMLNRLPYDVLLGIVQLLGARDVVRLCSTCRALYGLMDDRSMWHEALSRLLLLFPQPDLARRLARLSAEELKTQVLLSAQLDRLWHGMDFRPRLIQYFHCDGNVEHVNLVAGGRWLVVVLYDGSLQLHQLGAPAPAVTLSHSLTEDESVFYLSSRQSFTDDHEDLIILQMGVRYNQCNIYVYHVALVDPSPTFVLVGKISVTGSVWCCASGGGYLVYGLESGGGDMILHVCPVGADASEGKPSRRLSLNIGPWSADEDFSISILSERLLMLAYHGGLAVYAIPSSAPDELEPRLARPVWSRGCDIGSGIYRISPFSWNPHRHPIVIAGTRALHVLRVNPNSGVDVHYREIPYPLAPDVELGYVGLGAVGLRRAIWDSTETRNGSLHVHFRTYSLPRSILDLGDEDPDFGGGELGMYGRLGSFTVTLDPEEHLVNLCLEEGSGRVCLLLNNIMTGSRRISVIDVV